MDFIKKAKLSKQNENELEKKYKVNLEEKIRRENEELTKEIIDFAQKNIDIIGQEKSYRFTQSLAVTDYRYRKIDINKLTNLISYFDILKNLFQSYEFEIKNPNESENDSIQLLKGDPFAMNGIVISFDQIKKFIEYSFENAEEIINNPEFKETFVNLSTQMTEENKKAMKESLRNYLEDGYTICNFDLTNSNKTKENEFKIDFIDKEEPCINPNGRDWHGEYKNHKYYITTGKNKNIRGKKHFNPLEVNEDLFIMHYSRNNYTVGQFKLLKEFCNIFIIEIIKNKLMDNNESKKLNLIEFVEDLFENLFNPENIVSPIFMQKKVSCAFDEFFKTNKKNIAYENSDYVNFLLNHKTFLEKQYEKIKEIVKNNTNQIDKKTLKKEN